LEPVESDLRPTGSGLSAKHSIILLQLDHQEHNARYDTEVGEYLNCLAEIDLSHWLFSH
jgi:hypothetical protein